MQWIRQISQVLPDKYSWSFLHATGMWSVGLSSTIDFELLSSAWAFWFCILKLKLSSIRSIKTTTNRTKDHSRSLLLHRLPLLKPAVFHIHDPLSSSKNFLVYCTLLLNCPFCEYPEDIFYFGKRHFQWNWGATQQKLY